MVKEDPLAFRLDCGAVWLNLLATKGRTFGKTPVERLPTPQRLAEWLSLSELSTVEQPAAEDLRRTWQLRETLRLLALAAVDEQPPPTDAVDHLVTFLAQHDDPLQLTVDSRLHRSPPASVGNALARIARQAVDQLTGADRLALKSCPERDCRGVFTDPPGRRRWCPSPSCASRGRVRALRARRSDG